MMELKTPLSEKTVRGLKAGDVVYLTGDVITGRDAMHIRAMENHRSGRPNPEWVNNSVIFHCGPIVVPRGSGWKIIAAGPTTSARMDTIEPDMIRSFGIRAIIGKGGMSEEVGETMRTSGCVYLAAVGGTAISLAESIEEVLGAEWTDLGMAEAVWRLKVKKMGPLLVAMDAQGNSLYEIVRSKLIRI